MSLYNALMGTHPFASELLRVVGLRLDVVPRFRDAFLLELANPQARDGREFVVGCNPELRAFDRFFVVTLSDGESARYWTDNKGFIEKIANTKGTTTNENHR